LITFICEVRFRPAFWFLEGIARYFIFSATFFRALFFPKNHFAVAYELVVEPQAIFVRRRFAAGTRRAAEQTHAGGRLKHVRRKGAAIHVEFHAQVAGVGDPGDLIAIVENDDLRDESNEYGAFSHFSV